MSSKGYEWADLLVFDATILQIRKQHSPFLMAVVRENEWVIYAWKIMFFWKCFFIVVDLEFQKNSTNG